MSVDPFLAAVERTVIAPPWCDPAPSVLSLPEPAWRRALADAVAPF